MIKFLCNSFVAGQYYVPGMIADFEANIERDLITDGNAINLPLVTGSTWAEKPHFSSVDAGTAISLIDVGGGSTWVATYAGWVPQNGIVVLTSNWGTVASPVSSITGVANGLFQPIGGAGSLVIPAGMLLEGRAKLEIEVSLLRIGANGPYTANIYLGTASDVNDSIVFSVAPAATNNLHTRIYLSLWFNEGVVTTVSYQAPGASTAGALQDRAINIDLTKAMKISIGTLGTHTADRINLIGYSVKLVMI